MNRCQPFVGVHDPTTCSMLARTVTLYVTTVASGYMTDEQIADEVFDILKTTEDTPLRVVGITLPSEESED